MNTGVTRRDLLAGAGVTVAALATYPLLGAPSTALADSPPAAWNTDPDSPIGPGHWGDIGYPVCADGTGQSPVNIQTGKVRVVNGPPLLLGYEVSELAIENTGHVVEVMIPAGVSDRLQIGADGYALTQYHFHAPSEHTINGRRADVEAHFVHNNAQGDTAVVGVLFRMGRNPNRLLDRVLLAAPAKAGAEVLAGEANPTELLRNIKGVSVRGGHVQVDSFYAYGGSLTTPSCTESVRWSVLAEGGQVSHDAVRRFHRVISQFPGYGGYRNNNRPVQPLNGRVVELHQTCPRR